MRPTPSSQREPSNVPPLNIRLPDGAVVRFHRDFYIGRDVECEVHIEDVQASRRHAHVTFSRGQWTIRDLQSSNGLFVEGERVEVAPVGDGISVRFGEEGQQVWMGPGSAPVPPPQGDAPEPSAEVVAGVADRYLIEHEGDEDEEVGDRTRMIRVAFKQIQKKQKRRQRWVVAVLAVLGVGAAVYAYRTHKTSEEIRKQAQNFFYQMKDLDVTIAGIQDELSRSPNAVSASSMKALEERRHRLEQSYDEIAERVYGRRLTAQDRLILRVTRQFGECEVAAPPEYLGEVTRYINQWRRTTKFADAIKRAQAAGYPRRIASAFMARQLPPQYFYLALQESSFVPTAVGPPTRYGFAKGMWQFIPETGERFGLRRGPFAGDSRPDPADDRSNWERATDAAASYIKEIYRTDAQASGLLVMASYNWGERRVITRLKQMPETPRERNFWTLLSRYREDVPGETYNYVYSIVSAAVIGENPRLFGFNFDNPLAFATTSTPVSESPRTR